MPVKIGCRVCPPKKCRICASRCSGATIVPSRFINEPVRLLSSTFMETAAEADISRAFYANASPRSPGGASSYSAGGIGGGMPAAPANGSGTVAAGRKVEAAASRPERILSLGPYVARRQRRA